jgi:hypothetical protein
MYEHAWICLISFFKIGFLGFLYNKILGERQVGQVLWIDIPKRSNSNFSLQFLNICMNFHQFWRFGFSSANINNLKGVKTRA